MTTSTLTPQTARPAVAFTLIELLIVVAIIAILAAIAVPNFLEAQTRAKVSRAKSDMRTVQLAVETYKIDTNCYPPPYGIIANGRDSLSVISTPIAYVSAGKLVDPFAASNSNINKVALTYEAVSCDNRIIETGPKPPFSIAPTDPAAAKTAWCWVAARGPTRSFAGFSGSANPSIQQAFFEADSKPGAWVSMVYDPTNGTVSVGNIYRAAGGVRGFTGETMLR